MKQLILFIALITVSQSLFSQSKIDCNILQKSLELDFFKKRFFVDKYKDSVIVIVDTNSYFTNCDIKLDGKSVTFERHHTYSTERKANEKSYNKIVVNRIIKIKSSYRISFWRPYNNAAMTVEVRSKNNRLYTRVLDYGSF